MDSNLSIKKYFRRFSDATTIDIIGPFFDSQLNSSICEPLLLIDKGADLNPFVGKGLSIGDGDSSSQAMDVKLDIDKNFSDLAFALRQINSNITKVNLHGFLGGRKDHEFINITEVYRKLLSSTNKLKVLFDTQIIVISSGGWDLEINSCFSLLSLVKNQVNISGNCKYSYTGLLAEFSSHGLSNHGYGKLKISCTKPLALFLNTNKESI